MKQGINEYYNNNYKCQCAKQYSLTPLVRCCKISKKQRSNIPFDIHELVYLSKHLITTTRKSVGDEALKKLKMMESQFD